MTRKDKKRYVACRVPVSGLAKEQMVRLFATSRCVQEATNLVWITWERTMFAERRDEELRMFLEFYSRWKFDKSQEKPTLDFSVCDNELAKTINVVLADRVPSLHTRCRTLLQNATIKKSFSTPSRSCPSLKAWQAILLGRESSPRATRPLPIPFDSGNADLKNEDGKPVLYLRVDRIEQSGKVNAASTRERIVLDTSGSQSRFGKLIVEASFGERTWCGSTIQWNKTKRRWYVSLVVEAEALPETPKFSTSIAATLEAPESGSCWLLRCDGRPSLSIGSGRRIGYLRRRLDAAKSVRRADPFDAPSRTGHGRARAMRDTLKMTGKWTNTTRTLNQQAASAVMKQLKEWSVTSLAFKEPTAKCLLNTISQEIGPSWPLYHFREFLERKCKEQGIAIQIVAAKGDTSDVVKSGCDG